jgi:hypothetical protein
MRHKDQTKRRTWQQVEQYQTSVPQNKVGASNKDGIEARGPRRSPAAWRRAGRIEVPGGAVEGQGASELGWPRA